MAEALARLRLKGIDVIQYLYDISYPYPYPFPCRNRGEATGTPHSSPQPKKEGLVWILNIQKSRLTSAQMFLFLGYLINSVKQKIFLPKDRRDNLQVVMAMLQSNWSLSIRNLM